MNKTDVTNELIHRIGQAGGVVLDAVVAIYKATHLSPTNLYTVYQHVGTYMEAVRNQSCVIVAISTRHGESTAELSYDGTACRQLYAAKNTTPPRRHEQWMRAFVARLKRKSRTTIVGSWAA